MTEVYKWGYRDEEGMTGEEMTGEEMKEANKRGYRHDKGDDKGGMTREGMTGEEMTEANKRGLLA